jgi:heptosyltransferase-2
MKIAIYLPGWVGDAVMATPCLRAMRHHYRSAQITAIVKPYVAGVLEGGNWFDRLLVLPARHWDRGVLAAARHLRRWHCDLALLLSNSFRAALTVWLGRCRRRVGYARHGRSLLLTDAVPPVTDRAGRLVPSPILDAYNLLAEWLGCPAPGHRLQLFTTPTDEAAADRVWQLSGLEYFQEVVCLNPGAAFGRAKHWPTDYFATLARELAQQRGSGILVLGGPGELEMGREIATKARHSSVLALADYLAPGRADGPPLSLGLAKACVARCDLLVTTDSGPRHFAAAFDRPVITLFGPTHIAWTETYHPRAIHLQKQVPCGPCQKRVCPLDHRCMTQLTPREVFETAVTLLDQGERDAA